jgi:hypothetical protein
MDCNMLRKHRIGLGDDMLDIFLWSLCSYRIFKVSKGKLLHGHLELSSLWELIAGSNCFRMA